MTVKRLRVVERELIEAGYQRTYSIQHSKQPVSKLSSLKRGARVKVKSVIVRHQPAPGMSEASLIKALQERGIGRPATYSLIVESLITHKYVTRRDDGTLTTTDRGRKVLAFLLNEFKDVFDYDFTAKMERWLDEIAREQIDYEEVLNLIWKSLQNHS